MKELCKYHLPFLFICSLLIQTLVSAATDSINISESIRYGETLVSSGGVFELGFFSPGNSRNWYLGIWYYNMPNQTVVWVANREAPLTNNSGVLRVTKPGILSLLNETDSLIWSTNTSRTVQNPTARLLDSGNLVVKDAGDDRPENFLWQSFHHPSDTSLPGMRLGWNLVTRVGIFISSWRSNDDPAPGDFISLMDPSGYPQIFTKRGNEVLYRYGPWNGVQFSGALDISSNDQIYRLTIRINKNEVVYWEDVLQQSVVARITLDQQGIGGRWTWNNGTRAWNMYSRFPMDTCDDYNMCGAHGRCNVANSPPCECLDRFVQKDPERWSLTDWSSGCVRRAPLNCRDDVFLKYSGLKLPDSRNSSINDGRMSLTDCQAECSRNCTCMAYTRLNISKEGTGCLFYHGDLLDMRTVPAAGQDLYIRMSSTESESKGKKRAILIARFASVAGIVLCLIIIILFYTKRMKNKNRRKEVAGPPNASRGKEAELPFFNLSTILEATNHFSMANKLGEGGFGPVYRKYGIDTTSGFVMDKFWLQGMLEDEQEIAVKCLAKNSSQGVDELKNELMLIAKLQHRNLVRLLGGCIEREENMLIYEYMPNSSLDLIIFDQFKSRLLDWRKRFNIINGIAKGLLYLHQDSRLRIIHRDLKASNILLDADMNPKISDFGLARSFGGNETEAQTRRVVGTYGYMSPEYAIDGVFSIKSDVFSFGVLVLEIVSGKRNRGFFLKDHNLNLLGHAWTLYKEDKTSELVDTSLRDSLDLTQAIRSIHVALLCVQRRPDDRPSMSSVVFMLGNEVSLAQAKEPGFFTERDFGNANKSNSSNATNSENQVTISLLQGR